MWSACGGLECGVHAGGSSADLVGWRACTVLECGGHVEYWSAELMQGGRSVNLLYRVVVGRAYRGWSAEGM